MKHTKHKNRKSFSKWAMEGQRTLSVASKDVHHRTRSTQPHAQMNGNPPAFVAPIKSYDGLLPRDVGRSKGGIKVPSKGKIIPSHLYATVIAHRY